MHRNSSNQTVEQNETRKDVFVKQKKPKKQGKKSVFWFGTSVSKVLDKEKFVKDINTNTREIALMIQLEQQQHREFWVGWWGGVGHIPTTYIQLTL